MAGAGVVGAGAVGAGVAGAGVAGAGVAGAGVAGFGGAGGTVGSGFTATHPQRLWAESQKGFRDECPQRQSTTGLPGVVSIGTPA